MIILLADVIPEGPLPKGTTDDTESQAMARFAVVELPNATSAPSTPMILLRKLPDGCSPRSSRRLRPSTDCTTSWPGSSRTRHPDPGHERGWVLKLLDKYPTAERITQAQIASLEKIPYLSVEQAHAVHQAAEQSVASLRGDLAEALVRDLVNQLRLCQKAEQHLHQLLLEAFADLPASPHVQVLTITGIGEATAAALVAKIVDINRFATPNHLVSYFGVFPEESSSGVDKRQALAPRHTDHVTQGTLIMSPKGNDLVRFYLWNAARNAIQHNPAIRALYRRLRAKGKRGDVAFGHCMRSSSISSTPSGKPFAPSTKSTSPGRAVGPYSEAEMGTTSLTPEPSLVFDGRLLCLFLCDDSPLCRRSVPRFFRF